MPSHVESSPTLTPRHWVDIRAACAALSISRTTLFAWFARGCPSIRLKRKRLVDLEAARRWAISAFGEGDWPEAPSPRKQPRRARRPR